MQRDSRGATREQVAIATGISTEGGFAGGTTRRGSLNAKQTRERGERGGLLLACWSQFKKRLHDYYDAKYSLGQKYQASILFLFIWNFFYLYYFLINITRKFKES